MGKTNTDDAFFCRQANRTIPLPFQFTLGMQYLWEIDFSLHSRFDIAKSEGAFFYYVYLWLNQDKYQGLRLPSGPELEDYCSQPIEPDGTGIPLTRLMQAILTLKQDIGEAFRSMQVQDKLRYWAWFLVAFPQVGDSPRYRDFLFEPIMSSGAAVAPPLALVVEQQHNEGLASVDATTSEGALTLMQWWLSGGGLEVPLLLDAADEWARRWREDLATKETRELALACEMALWVTGKEPFTQLAPTLGKQEFLHATVAETAGIPLTRFMQLLLLVREDIRETFADTTNPEVLLRFWGCFLVAFPQVGDSPRYRDFLFEPIMSSGAAVAPPLALVVEQQHNEGLASVDATTSEGALTLMQWWLSGGGLEVPLLLDAADEWARRWREDLATKETRELALACEMALWVTGKEPFTQLAPTLGKQEFLHATVAETAGIPLTRFMQLLLLVREDIRETFADTTNPEVLLQFWGWIVLELPQVAVHDAFLEQATRPVLPPTLADVPTLPLGLCAFWWAREDLQGFDRTTSAGAKALQHWWRVEGVRDWSFLDRLAKRLDRTQVLPSARHHNQTPVVTFAGDRQSGGANIIGFAKGEFGIGEDARMAARACQEAGIPVCVLDVPYEISTRREDRRLDALLCEAPRFAVNIFCMPVFEVLRMYFLYGEELFRGRYNIGICPWELPTWPVEMADALSRLDALWAPSAYVQSAYAARTTRPVQHIPLAVEAAKVTTLPRAAYGIPDDAFVFLFICDAASWTQRKNPLGLVEAFCRAFPDPQAAGVRLVIKTMNNQPDAPAFQALRAWESRDIGLILIDRTLDYDVLLGLHACSDAYVSLHRAEGFGRTLAEAMLLGKPVITSAFSGNLEFCNEETAFLVDGHTVAVTRGDYIFSENQYWFEPDLDVAAALMREVRTQPGLAAQRARNGRLFIEQHHSPARVGQVYRKLLCPKGLLYR